MVQFFALSSNGIIYIFEFGVKAWDITCSAIWELCSLKSKPEEIETEPDGWDRFQRTMDKIVPPKHRSLEDGEATDKPEKPEP